MQEALGISVSKYLRKKIAIVQNRVWATMPEGPEKAAVAAVCDGLLDALDEKDRTQSD